MLRTIEMNSIVLASMAVNRTRAPFAPRPARKRCRRC